MPDIWQSGIGLATPATPEAVAARNRLWQPAYEALAQGVSQLEKGDPKAAEALAHRCIALTPKGDQPMGAADLLISDSRMEAGDYEGALAHYKKGSRTTWQAGQGLNVPICLIRLGRVKEARALHSDEQILKYNLISKADLPGTSNARTLEASLLLARGLDRYFSSHYEKALQDFEAAQELAPGNAVAAYHGGKALLSMGRMAEAKEMFRVAVKNGKSEFVKDAASWVR